MSSGMISSEFNSIIEEVRAILWRAEVEPLRFTFVSKEAEEMLGYPVEQWLDEPDFWQEHIYEEDRSWAIELCTKATLENKAHDFEYRMVAADGRLVWVQDIVRVIAKEGKPKELTGVIIDITHRMQMEQSLRESEERYRNLFENANDIIYTHDLDGNITSLNKAAELVTGYSREEGLRLNISQILGPQHLDLARQMLKRKIAGQKTPAYEMDVIAKDGHIITIELSSSLIYENEKPVGVQGVARDITARKRAEKIQAATYRISEAAHSTESLQALFRSTHEITSELMPADNFYIALYDTDSASISFPYFVDESEAPPAPRKLGKGLTERVLREGRPLQAPPEVLDDLIKKGEAELIGAPAVDWLGVPLKVKDKIIGAIVVQSYTAGLRFGEEEKAVLEFVSTEVATAIERKRTEDKMNRTLSLLSATLESTADGILVVNNEGKIVSYNKKFVQMWRIPQNVIASKDDERALKCVLAQLKDKKAFIAKVRELYAQEEAESYDMIEFIDGRAFERYSQPQRIEGNSIGRVWSFRDVTERCRAEREQTRMLALELAARHEAEHVSRLRRELLESEEEARREWQATFDAMTDAIVLVDRSDRLLRANRTFYEKFNLVPDKCIGRQLKKLLHQGKERFPALEPCPVCELRTRGERAAVEFPPGVISDYPVFASTAPITDDDGNIIAVVEVIRDLTDLYAARELAERERISLNATIEQMAEGFIVFNESSAVVRANRQAQRMLGFTLEQMGADRFCSLIEGRLSDDSGQLIEIADTPLKIALGEQRVADTALWYTGPDGEKALLAVTASPFFDNGGQIAGAMMLMRDVTERKRERERLQQAEKLRALGQLASGVAHNFNNALAAVIGYAQLALPKVNNPDIEKYLRVIEQSAKDAARMVERIQNFSRARQRKDDLMPVRLADIVRDAIDITRPRWRHDAESLSIKYNVSFQWQAEDDALISGEPSELREVFVNIILNSLDAMPKGGRLSITASADESNLVVSLADTGAGMTEEIRQRIFEPFFTTKGMLGLGMGLSESYRIIERHGGRIDVESRLRHGTTFIITLPLAKPAEPVSLPDVAQSPGAGARVLVIEDEEFVRNVLSAILVEQGHRVFKAASAAEGLRMIEQNEFDLVFTDLAMPQADGITVACGIKERSPETKVVLMSGYGADKAHERAASSDSIDAVISKPFHLAEIRETIKKLLDKESVG